MEKLLSVQESLKDRTESTEDNLVSFELSLIIRDQHDVCISSLLGEIFEDQLEMLLEGVYFSAISLVF